MTDEWLLDAACHALEDETHFWFFAGGTEDEERPEVMRQHAEARKICYRDCPVQVECLRYCIDTDSSYGIWGGLTPSQRKRHLGRRTVVSDDKLAEIIVSSGRRVLNRILKEAQEDL